MRQSGCILLLGLVLSSSNIAGALARPSRTSSKPAAANQPQALERNQQQQQTAGSSFAAAPSCMALPTAATSKPDSTGRLWGQLKGARCAFKNAAGHALFYTGYEPGSWLHTAACSMPAFSDNSVTDSKLRTWGWEPSGSLCAFKDDQQLPIPPQRSYTMLSWQEAPACKEAPTPTAANAAADRFGCLWGWQLERNCAYRDIAGRPLYYQGYKGACDSAGSAKRAAEFNAKAAGDDTADGSRSAPRVVTGLGCIGQRNAPAAPGSSSPPCTDTTVPVDFGPAPQASTRL